MSPRPTDGDAWRMVWPVSLLSDEPMRRSIIQTVLLPDARAAGYRGRMRYGGRGAGPFSGSVLVEVLP